ncbi:MAG: hypothetical protein GY928_37335 [Colwellia sp.]|nr:hypothetical protein [Colwellia sp.]
MQEDASEESDAKEQVTALSKSPKCQRHQQRRNKKCADCIKAKREYESRPDFRKCVKLNDSRILGAKSTCVTLADKTYFKLLTINPKDQSHCGLNDFQSNTCDRNLSFVYMVFEGKKQTVEEILAACTGTDSLALLAALLLDSGQKLRVMDFADLKNAFQRWQDSTGSKGYLVCKTTVAAVNKSSPNSKVNLKKGLGNKSGVCLSGVTTPGRVWWQKLNNKSRPFVMVIDPQVAHNGQNSVLLLSSTEGSQLMSEAGFEKRPDSKPLKDIYRKMSQPGGPLPALLSSALREARDLFAKMNKWGAKLNLQQERHISDSVSGDETSSDNGDNLMPYIKDIEKNSMVMDKMDVDQASHDEAEVLKRKTEDAARERESKRKEAEMLKKKTEDAARERESKRKEEAEMLKKKTKDAAREKQRKEEAERVRRELLEKKTQAQNTMTPPKPPPPARMQKKKSSRSSASKFTQVQSMHARNDLIRMVSRKESDDDDDDIMIITPPNTSGVIPLRLQ